MRFWILIVDLVAQTLKPYEIRLQGAFTQINVLNELGV